WPWSYATRSPASPDGFAGAQFSIASPTTAFAIIDHGRSDHPTTGLFRTVDGGQHWEAVATGLTDLGLVSFSDERRGWSVSAGGLYRTIDGGHRWQFQVLPDAETDLDGRSWFFGPSGLLSASHCGVSSCQSFAYTT